MKDLASLDLNHLLTFQVFVDEGTVHATARALGRSQPAISARLKQLREALGAELVVRRGRRLALTPVGRRVYEHARRIRAQAQRMLDEVRSDGEGGTLRVGVLPTIGVFLVAPVIAGMRARNPQIRFEIESALVAHLLERLESADVDIVVGVGGLPEAEQVVPLGEICPVLVVNETFARRDPHAAVERALTETPWITYGHVDDDFFNSVERFLRARGITDRVVVRVSHIETIRSLIAADAGVAILPDYTVRQPGLTSFPVPGLKFRQKAWVALRAASYEIASVRRFLDALAGSFRDEGSES